MKTDYQIQGRWITGKNPPPSIALAGAPYIMVINLKTGEIMAQQIFAVDVMGYVQQANQ